MLPSFEDDWSCHWFRVLRKKAIISGSNALWKAVRSKPGGSAQILGASSASFGEQTARNAKWFAFATKCHSGLDASPDRGGATAGYAVGLMHRIRTPQLNGDGHGREMIGRQ